MILYLKLLATHQQELDEIMEKMDTEKQRQKANVHQKLLERKKQRQDAQKRKQEREMAKELLEQKKELAEVRSEHVSSILVSRVFSERVRDDQQENNYKVKLQLILTAQLSHHRRGQLG